METVGCGKKAWQGSGVRGAVWAQRPVLSPPTQRPMDGERQQLLLSGQNQTDVKFVNFLFHSLPCGHVIKILFKASHILDNIRCSPELLLKKDAGQAFCFFFPLPVLCTSTALARSPPSPRHQK